MSVPTIDTGLKIVGGRRKVRAGNPSSVPLRSLPDRATDRLDMFSLDGALRLIQDSKPTADEKFGKLAERTLLEILAGWGSQVLSNYPGPLLKATEGKISAFDDFAAKTLDDAVRRSREG